MPAVKSLLRFAILGATFFLLIMLFIGGPDISDNRLLNELWQTGHFFLFALLVMLIAQLPTFEQASFLALLFWSFLFCHHLACVVVAMVFRCFIISHPSAPVRDKAHKAH